MKIPKYLEAPSTNWTERAGMRRAIAVLKAEAAVLKKQGFALQPAALRRVAAALQATIVKQGARAEADTLQWHQRINNPQGDAKT